MSSSYVYTRQSCDVFRVGFTYVEKSEMQCHSLGLVVWQRHLALLRLLLASIQHPFRELSAQANQASMNTKLFSLRTCADYDPDHRRVEMPVAVCTLRHEQRAVITL